MAIATITSRGQITLPKEVREHLGLERGDRVDFSIDDEGNVRVRAARQQIGDLFGFLRRPAASALSMEEIDKAITQSRVDDDERIQAGWRNRDTNGVDD